jgi:hypothetical protein
MRSHPNTRVTRPPFLQRDYSLHNSYNFWSLSETDSIHIGLYLKKCVRTLQTCSFKNRILNFRKVSSCLSFTLILLCPKNNFKELNFLKETKLFFLINNLACYQTNKKELECTLDTLCANTGMLCNGLCQKLPIPGAERLVVAREAGEGCPLLTVETDANGDSWSINERGPSLTGSFGSSCRYKRFFYLALTALVSPVQNIFFPYRTLCHFICPHRPATWARSRAGSPVS